MRRVLCLGVVVCLVRTRPLVGMFMFGFVFLVVSCCHGVIPIRYFFLRFLVCFFFGRLVVAGVGKSFPSSLGTLGFVLTIAPPFSSHLTYLTRGSTSSSQEVLRMRSSFRYILFLISSFVNFAGAINGA